MGRVERIEYSCDWCGHTVRAVHGPGGELDAPDTWRVLDSLGFDDYLCEECAKAGAVGLASAKAARVSGLPLSATVPADSGGK